MIRISLPFFCNLFVSLNDIKGIKPGDDIRQSLGDLYSVRQNLQMLFGAQWLAVAVKAAERPGRDLINAIDRVTAKQIDFSAPQPLDFYSSYAISSARSEFETVLRNQLAVCDVFFVSPKAGYATDKLIDSAEVNFPADLAVKVPQAVQGAREAGRCLAFELNTASGFHVMRALEWAVRAYCREVCGSEPADNNRNLGVYIDHIGKNSTASAGVVAVLRQIKGLHRNPLIHEVSLDGEDAVALLGMAQSAISAMLKKIGASAQREIAAAAQANE